jgi:hypothetical protein
MSVGRRASVLVVACAALATPRFARADACGAPLISTCIDDDTLWPHAGPSQFVSVGGAETTQRGQFGFGLVTSYLSQPIVLHLSEPGPGGSNAYGINNQINGTFLWSYGVTSRLELDFAVPITFAQNGSGTTSVTGQSPQTALQTSALRDLRFGFAYALVPRARVEPWPEAPGSSVLGHLVAVTARFEMSAPTGDQYQFGADRTAVWIPSVAADLRKARFFAGLEVGARIRPVTELVGARVGSQINVGVGAGVDVLPRELLSVVAEARALPTFAEQHSVVQEPTGIVSTPDGKTIAPAEWMLSVRSAPLPGGDLTVQLGGGGPIPFTADTITNPRFRFALSIRYAPLGRDTDGDGILDRDDKCPHVPGVRGSKYGDGCPPAPEEHETLDLSGPSKAQDDATQGPGSPAERSEKTFPFPQGGH